MKYHDDNSYRFWMRNCDGTTFTLRGNKLLLSDVLQDFEQFLRGAGYCFDGHLEIQEDSNSELRDWRAPEAPAQPRQDDISLESQARPDILDDLYYGEYDAL